MESPSSLDKQSLCYSMYKSHTTNKALIGITTYGVVSFASELIFESINDPEIVEKSGLYCQLKKGDVVMVDKSFLMCDQLAKVGACLAMPHFLKDKGKFTQKECKENKTIASFQFMLNNIWNVSRTQELAFFRWGNSNQMCQYCL